MIKNFIYDYEDFTREGLLYSEPILNVISDLERNIESFDFHITPKNDYSFKIVFETVDNLNSFFTNIAVCGWVVSYFHIWTTNKDIKFKNIFNKDLFYSLYRKYESTITSIEFIVESKRNKSYKETDIICPDYLYHVAPMRVKNKIMKHGLVPKSRSKLSYHDSRIYLLGNKSKYIPLANKMKAVEFEYTTKKYKDTKTIEMFDLNNIESDFYKLFLIEIDTNINDLKNNIVLNSDPNHIDGGYFTYNNIFPENLKVIMENI